MPIYEYACKKCGKTFEHLHRTLSSPAPKCPACGASHPQKQLSVFSAAVAASESSVCDACPTSGKCPSASRCAGSCGLGME
jgi:putative FmdB family regulatory protein